MSRICNCEVEIGMLTSTYCHYELPTSKRVELDVGCGKGKFTAELAARYPESQIVAADIMVGRVRKLKKKCERLEIANMALLRVEATALMGYILKDNSVDRLHILCPDPWPKSKHKGHRLLSSQFMSSIVRVLKPGGVFHFATDNIPYFESVTCVLEKSGLFQKEDQSLISDIIDIKTDFQLRWEDEGLEVQHVAWKSNQ